MSLYSRFCAWLSGWPEPKEIYHFEEEEAKIRENNKNIGKKPKGLKSKK